MEREIYSVVGSAVAAAVVEPILHERTKISRENKRK
jgi:hypothetical protein